MFDYHGNEDAGDLRAMGWADYCGEMAEQADFERRNKYVERFDAVTTSGWRYASFFEAAPAIPTRKGPDGRWIHGRGRLIGRVVYHVHGPREAPYCDDCCERLERDNPNGIYTGDFDALMFCSQECRDRYDSIPGYSEGREFPTYG